MKLLFKGYGFELQPECHSIDLMEVHNDDWVVDLEKIVRSFEVLWKVINILPVLDSLLTNLIFKK